MKFNYYYGSEADQFSFIRIPKVLLIDEKFKILSIQSKMLYGMLLDRMGLSMKNSWFDSENKVYIIYKISEIQKDLGFSKRKAMDYLMELEEFGLVEKKKRGFGLPSILYVKSFMGVEEKEEEDESIEKEGILKGGDVNATSVVKAELKNNIEGTNNVTSITQNRNHRDMEKRKTRKFHESCSETVNVAVKGVENNINGGVETDTTRDIRIDTTGCVGIDITRGAETDTTGDAGINISRGAEIDTSY